jgi:hypothetical protein
MPVEPRSQESEAVVRESPVMVERIIEKEASTVVMLLCFILVLVLAGFLFGMMLILEKRDRDRRIRHRDEKLLRNKKRESSNETNN